MQNIDAMIATLNTIEVGELDSIRKQMSEVRAELERCSYGELVEKIDECLGALGRGDLKDFRRLKETIVSRLGHLR
jgi:hypothetical protein